MAAQQQNWQGDVFRQLGGGSTSPAPADAVPSPATSPPTESPGTNPSASAPSVASGQPSMSPAPPPPRRLDHVPEPRQLAAPELDGAAGRPRRGDAFPTRVTRALRRFVSAAAQDTAATTETVRAIQQPVTTGRQLAVTSIRGGAGKSTVAALLSLTYAHYRSDPVLSVEADPAIGTLPGRLGVAEVRWTCSDLARIVDPSMQITDVTGYLVRLVSGGWLLPGSRGSVGADLDIDTYRMVMTSLRRYFGVTVVDCETIPAEVARTALVTTQARVLVCPATVEGVTATREVLDWLGSLHRSLLPTTVVALTRTTPDMSLASSRAAAYLSAGGASVVPLPYDRHLASGGVIRPELLGEATREAVSRLAAETLSRSVARTRADGPAGGARQ